MFRSLSPHARAVLQALFVTFLWSTSWVLIKFGLQDQIPALTFAGLRYILALLCLLPLLARQPHHAAALRRLPLGAWGRLAVLGLLFYTVNQGAQFVGLAYLPALTVNLLLSFTAVVVTLLGIIMLRERPTGLQWAGLALYILGVVVYFYPVGFPAEQVNALLVVIGGMLASAVGSVLGRWLNRSGDLSPLSITVASMGIGAPVLLGAGILFQGLPPLQPQSWAIIAWLAVVNTALAFTLWNKTLRTLSAMESSVINNTMMVQIPVMAWLFLGEGISEKAAVGFALAGLGILIVQLRQIPPRIRSRWRARPLETDVTGQPS
jgi:drug/metabolite transporter (DMT)-like permease